MSIYYHNSTNIKQRRHHFLHHYLHALIVYSLQRGGEVQASKDLVSVISATLSLNYLACPHARHQLKEYFQILESSKLNYEHGLEKTAKLVACYRKLRGCQERRVVVNRFILTIFHS